MLKKTLNSKFNGEKVFGFVYTKRFYPPSFSPYQNDGLGRTVARLLNASISVKNQISRLSRVGVIGSPDIPIGDCSYGQGNHAV